MKYHGVLRSSFVLPTLVVMGIGAAAVAQHIPTPCYIATTKLCSSFHANTTRVCSGGATAQPCADLITHDFNTPDVATSTSGQDRIQTGVPGGYTTYTTFYCSGSACLQSFSVTKNCLGRVPTGDQCGGGGVD